MSNTITHTSAGIRFVMHKARFTKWLSGKAKNNIVGISEKTNQCPLSNYFKSYGVWDEVLVQPWEPVGFAWFWKDEVCKGMTLPPWAERFGREVDTLRCYCQPVTAEDCLTILELI